MATIQDIAELLIKVGGIEELKKAADALQRVGQAGKQAAVDTYDFADVYELVEVESVTATKSIDTTTASLTRAAVAADKTTTATKGVGQGTKGAGQGIQQLAFAVQDFLSANGDLLQGLYRVQNNLPVIAERFGLNAGLAGQISLVSLAVGTALPYIIEWGKQFFDFGEVAQRAGDKVEGLKKQIKIIEEKPIKLGADLTELENARKELQALEDARKAFEEFGKLRAEPVKKSGEEVQKALAEAPGGAGRVHDALEKAAVAQAQANDQAVQAAEFEMEDAKRRIRENEEALKQRSLPAQAAQGFVEDIERQKKFINASEEKKNTALDLAAEDAKREIGKIYKGAVEGDVARQRELQQKLREVGEGELAKQIRAVSPENIRAKQLEEEGGKLEEEARKELVQAEKERAEEDAKHIEEQLHNRDVIEKQLSDATADARKKQEDAEKRRLATLARRVGGGTLGEEAQDYAARVQEARPGITDADLRAEVSRAVAAEVARRAPQLAPAERAGVTTAVTEQALAAPPEDVAARQARAARAAPRQHQAEMAQGYTQEAQARGFNPQAAAEIGRRASAAFARTGDLEGSFMEAIAGFQQVLMGMQQHQQRMQAGLARVQANNGALMARQRTAARNGGMQ
jgi:hypothetical protein